MMFSPTVLPVVETYLSNLFGPQGFDYHFQWVDENVPDYDIQMITRDGMGVVVDDVSPAGQTKQVSFENEASMLGMSLLVRVTKHKVRLLKRGDIDPAFEMDEMILMLWMNEQNKQFELGTFEEPEVVVESFDELFEKMAGVEGIEPP